MLYQRTLAKVARVTGIGIHSGKKTILTIHPADADTGIRFKRVDIAGSKVIQADAHTVGATENNTAIGTGKEVIHTVEHLLSTFYGLGINNAYCEIDGPEIPIMDGSAASFVFLLKETGIVNLNTTKKFLVVLEKIRVEKDDAWAEIEPNSNLVVDSTIVFAHPVIKEQREVFEYSCENYIKEISRARTFGFFRDVDYLKRRGLAKGGSLDNAVVLDDFRVMNPEGLRYATEFVRHKILDTIGDMSLLGHEIAGKITSYKAGHNLNNMLCRKLLETPSAYEVVSASSLNKDVAEKFEIPQFVTTTH